MNIKFSMYHDQLLKQLKRGALALFSMVVLSACGGGGGGQTADLANSEVGLSAKAQTISRSVTLSASSRVSIDNFDDRSTVTPWSFWSSGTGATGSISSGSGYSQSHGLSLNYNFACIATATGQSCGQYVATLINLANPINAGTALTFLTKSPAAAQLVVRVIDQSGQVFQYRPVRPLEGYDPDTWYRAIMLLNDPQTYWGGANNGIIQGQIKSIWIISDKPKSYPSLGTISIDEIEMISGWTPPGALSPATGVIPIDDFNNRTSVSPWSFWGEGGAGAKGSVSLQEGYETTGGLALSYDLSCVTLASGKKCGQYATAIFRPTNAITAGAALSFMTRWPSNIQLVVRVIDESGQTLQYRPARPTDASNSNNWVQMIINLGKPESYWSGAKNGVLQGNIKEIWILAADPLSYPATGTLNVDNIVMLPNLTDLPPAGSIPGAVSIDDFQNRSIVAPWSFWNTSNTGGNGSINSTAGYGSARGLALNYAFTCVTATSCGKSAAAILTLPQPVFIGKAISLMTKSPSNIELVLRVIDQSGQTLQYRSVRPMEGYDASLWYRAVVALDKPESYWGGANNGIVQGQVNSVWVIADNPMGKPSSGTVVIDNLTMLNQWNAPTQIPVVNGVATIDDFENRSVIAPWSTWSEGGTGATGTVTSITGYAGSRGLALNYNLTCATGPGTNCGQYVAATLKLPLPVSSSAAISLKLRSSPDIQPSLRVIDQTGQTLQYRIERPLEGSDTTQWYQALVKLNAPAAYWGGANNGTVQGQITSIWLIAGSPQIYPAVGTLAIDNVTALSTIDDTYSLNVTTTALLPVAVGAEKIGPRIGVAFDPTNAVASLDAARDAGVAFIRMDLFWNWVELTKNVYDFSVFDQLVNAAEARNLGVLLVLAYGNPLYDIKTSSGITAYANFAQAAAAHYAGRNVRFEIWNEPDGVSYWGPALDPVQQYAALCKAAIASIRLANPSALISTGGLSWFNFDYLSKALASGIAENATAIGIHGYRNGGPESIVSDLISANWRIKNILNKNIPVWNTEWGYSTDRISGDGHSDTFRQQQAILVVRQLLAQWALNVPVAVIFNLVDGGIDPNNSAQNSGLLDASYAEKPGLRSLRTFTTAAQSKTNKGLVADVPSGLHIMKLEDAVDILFVAWNSSPGTNVSVDVPSAGLTTVANHIGAIITGTTTGSRVSFTLHESDGPIYIKYRK